MHIAKLRGSAASILEILSKHADNQHVTISLRDLSILSGYCVPSVSMAIRKLEIHRYISKESHGRLPASYIILPESQRYSIIARELMSLLEKCA